MGRRWRRWWRWRRWPPQRARARQATHPPPHPDNQGEIIVNQLAIGHGNAGLFDLCLYAGLLVEENDENLLRA